MGLYLKLTGYWALVFYKKYMKMPYSLNCEAWA